jgi:hypothetical protein
MESSGPLQACTGIALSSEIFFILIYSIRHRLYFAAAYLMYAGLLNTSRV